MFCRNYHRTGEAAGAEPQTTAHADLLLTTEPHVNESTEAS
jgi:hypothetical protein